MQELFYLWIQFLYFSSFLINLLKFTYSDNISVFWLDKPCLVSFNHLSQHCSRWKSQIKTMQPFHKKHKIKLGVTTKSIMWMLKSKSVYNYGSAKWSQSLSIPPVHSCWKLMTVWLMTPFTFPCLRHFQK